MEIFLRHVVKFFIKSIFVVISSIVLYIFIAGVLSCIICNTNFKGEAEGIDVYILSNGVHTDLVFPAKNKCMDWTKLISTNNTRSQDSCVSFMAFGWGDKGFYLETPSWTDLKCSTVFKAMVGRGTSAMHVCNYKLLTENDHCKKIVVSEENYKKLTAYVLSGFLKNKEGDPICINGSHYNEHDAFYEAAGNYSILKTCNTWVNEGLKVSGLKACLWTPFDKGIFIHY